MRTRIAAVAIIAAHLAAVAVRADDGRSSFAAGEILVRFTARATAEQVADLEETHRLERLSSFPHLRVVHYGVPAGRLVRRLMEAIAGHPAVELVEPNHVRRLRGTPNDPLFADQWYLHNDGQAVNGQAGVADADIDWPEANQAFTGNSAVTVAVVDSGLAVDHPDFQGRIWLNPVDSTVDGIDQDGNGLTDDTYGWDFFDDDHEPTDEYGHGTQVAALIAAASDDAVGVAGASSTAKIMVLRIFNDLGQTTASGVIEATTYAAQQGADIINLSLGAASTPNACEQLQIEWLDGQGILVVAAAGNGGPDSLGDDNDSQPFFPASYDVPNILSVAATDQADALAIFSNYGVSSVDLAAPGTNIQSASVTRRVVASEDFEGGAPGWTVENACVGFCNDWSLFVDAFGDTWANDSMDLSNGQPLFYFPDTDAWMTSPAVDLPTDGPLGIFRAWKDLAFLDLVSVEITTDGVFWTSLGILLGSSATAAPGVSPDAGELFGVDLSPWAGQTVLFRFRILTDSAFQADGIYVDDLSISEVETFAFDGTQFNFTQGTSFSAPLVAGTAAMMMSQRPDLDHRTIRQLILSSVDPVSSLAGRVATGGRLNARSALAAVIAVPEPAASVQALALLATVGCLARSRRV